MAEAVITLPDGRRARITGPTREAITAQAQQFTAAPADAEPTPAPESTSQEAFAESGFNRFVNNLLAVPSASGDLLAAGAAGVEGVAAKLSGGPADFGRRYEEQQQKFPASALRAIPRPTMQDLEAAGATVRSGALLPGGETPSAAFGAAKAGIEAEDAALRAEHPIASAAGDITGDVASLVTGRAPVANLVRKAEQRLAPKVADMSFGGATKAAVGGPLSPARVAENIWTSPKLRRVARGLGRSAETGIEAAVLEVMKGGEEDPLSAAALAAGGQAGASVMLQMGQGLLSGGWKDAGVKVGAAAFSVWSLWQLAKSATPGGEDRILESIETGYDKIAASLVLGSLAAISGAPRFRDANLDRTLTQVVDAAATVPRGVTLSWLTNLVGSDGEKRAETERALQGLMNDPEYKGETESERNLVIRLRSEFGADSE
jgi:hypothetical protein